MQSRPRQPERLVEFAERLLEAAVPVLDEPIAGRTRSRPCRSSTPSTVDITWVIVSIWRFRVLPRLVSCSGFAPYIVMIVSIRLVGVRSGDGPVPPLDTAVGDDSDARGTRTMRR